MNFNEILSKFESENQTNPNLAIVFSRKKYNDKNIHSWIFKKDSEIFIQKNDDKSAYPIRELSKFRKENINLNDLNDYIIIGNTDKKTLPIDGYISKIDLYDRGWEFQDMNYLIKKTDYKKSIFNSKLNENDEMEFDKFLLDSVIKFENQGIVLIDFNLKMRELIANNKNELDLISRKIKIKRALIQSRAYRFIISIAGNILNLRWKENFKNDEIKDFLEAALVYGDIYYNYDKKEYVCDNLFIEILLEYINEFKDLSKKYYRENNFIFSIFREAKTYEYCYRYIG